MCAIYVHRVHCMRCCALCIAYAAPYDPYEQINDPEKIQKAAAEDPEIAMFLGKLQAKMGGMGGGMG